MQEPFGRQRVERSRSGLFIERPEPPRLRKGQRDPRVILKLTPDASEQAGL